MNRFLGLCFVLLTGGIVGTLFFGGVPDKAKKPRPERTKSARAIDLTEGRSRSAVRTRERGAHTFADLEGFYLDEFSLRADEDLEGALERLLRRYATICRDTGEEALALTMEEIRGEPQPLIRIPLKRRSFTDALKLTAALAGMSIHHDGGMLKLSHLTDRRELRITSERLGQLQDFVYGPVVITESRIEMPVFQVKRGEPDAQLLELQTDPVIVGFEEFIDYGEAIESWGLQSLKRAGLFPAGKEVREAENRDLIVTQASATRLRAILSILAADSSPQFQVYPGHERKGVIGYFKKPLYWNPHTAKHSGDVSLGSLGADGAFGFMNFDLSIVPYGFEQKVFGDVSYFEILQNLEKQDEGERVHLNGELASSGRFDHRGSESIPAFTLLIRESHWAE